MAWESRALVALDTKQRRNKTNTKVECLAVLAALNIADECFRLRGAAGETGSKLQKRAARLAEELGAVLGD